MRLVNLCNIPWLFFVFCAPFCCSSGPTQTALYHSVTACRRGEKACYFRDSHSSDVAKQSFSECTLKRLLTIKGLGARSDKPRWCRDRSRVYKFHQHSISTNKLYILPVNGYLKPAFQGPHPQSIQELLGQGPCVAPKHWSDLLFFF